MKVVEKCGETPEKKNETPPMFDTKKFVKALNPGDVFCYCGTGGDGSLLMRLSGWYSWDTGQMDLSFVAVNLVSGVLYKIEAFRQGHVYRLLKNATIVKEGC